jgi:hypothetical protein
MSQITQRREARTLYFNALFVTLSHDVTKNVTAGDLLERMTELTNISQQLTHSLPLKVVRRA